eukprot:Pgem_evm1s533
MINIIVIMLHRSTDTHSEILANSEIIDHKHLADYMHIKNADENQIKSLMKAFTPLFDSYTEYNNTPNNHQKGQTEPKQHDNTFVHHDDVLDSLIIDKPENMDFSDEKVTANSITFNPETNEGNEHNICKIQRNAPKHLTRLSTPDAIGTDHNHEAHENIYSYENEGKGVHVYILDSGISTSEFNLGGRLLSNFDFTGLSKSTRVPVKGGKDVDGHGTHVAGIVGSKKYGVAKQAFIHNYRVLNDEGEGRVSDIIKGIDWAIADSEKRVPRGVINLSLTTESVNGQFHDALVRAHRAGFVVIAAAGNGINGVGIDACTISPSSTPEVITVGAINGMDQRTRFSNHGKCIDIFAIGQSDKSLSAHSSEGYEIQSGTSQASPVIAGLAALILEKNPDFTPIQVKEELQKNAVSGKISNCRSKNNYIAQGYCFTPQPQHGNSAVES